MKLTRPLSMLIPIMLLASCGSPTSPGNAIPASTPPQASTPSGAARSTASLQAPTETLRPVDTATPDVAATVMAIAEPRTYSSHRSPDGLWRSEVVVYHCVLLGEIGEHAYEELRLVNISSGVERIVDKQLQYCGGMGAFGLEGLFWSPNSRYFYYTDAREGVPDGCGHWDRPIIRVDVDTQASEALGAGPRSPDGTRLATWQGRELALWDVNQAEAIRVPAIAPETQTGPIAWSPDSQSLVYLLSESWCPTSGKSYVVRVDVGTLKQTLLIESEEPTFANVVWNQTNELILTDANKVEWRYDLVTQQLEKR